MCIHIIFVLVLLGRGVPRSRKAHQPTHRSVCVCVFCIACTHRRQHLLVGCVFMHPTVFYVFDGINDQRRLVAPLSTFAAQWCWLCYDTHFVGTLRSHCAASFVHDMDCATALENTVRFWRSTCVIIHMILLEHVCALIWFLCTAAFCEKAMLLFFGVLLHCVGCVCCLHKYGCAYTSV